MAMHYFIIVSHDFCTSQPVFVDFATKLTRGCLFSQQWKISVSPINPRNLKY